jgi:hypothetical protein
MMDYCACMAILRIPPGDVRRFPHRVRTVGVLASLAAVATLLLPIRGAAATTWYGMYKVDTGSVCSLGRTCLTRIAVSSCSGTGNLCIRYNAPGLYTDGASIMDTSGDSFGPFSGNARYDAERAYNNNSGTLRNVCAFHLTYNSGSYQTVYYGGWAILPFTGAGSLVTLPFGWMCLDLVNPGP